MKTKLLLLLVLAGLTGAPFTFAQTEMTPTPALSPSAQTTPTQQMQGMDSTPDSMKQMAEMCQKMMRNEEAAMPYIVGIPSCSVFCCSSRWCSSSCLKFSGSNIGVEN